MLPEQERQHFYTALFELQGWFINAQVLIIIS